MAERSRRRWLPAALAGVVLLAGGGALAAERWQDDGCTSMARIIDGVVLPGGPQSPREALERNLDANEGSDARFLTGQMDDYREVRRDATTATWSSGSIEVMLDQRPEGWAITLVRQAC